MTEGLSRASCTAIVLAAGQGKRMKSRKPKVLHEICGRPMIDHVLRAAFAAGVTDAVVVVGVGSDIVDAHLREAFGERVRSAVQPTADGTGHAAACALPVVPGSAETALLLYADTPLVQAEDLRRLLAARATERYALAMLTCTVSDPTGYGRILRDGQGRIVGVREHRDADAATLKIHEVNPGMYAADLTFLREALGALDANNAQGELYLTDIVAAAGASASVVGCAAAAETLVGVNDRAQLAAAEQVMYQRIADAHRRRGVTIRAGVSIDAEVELSPEAVIEQGVVLRGTTRVGPGTRIDVGCVLDDVTLAAGAYLKPYSVLQQSTVGGSAQVGPFAHLRPNSHIEEGARIGNFVEAKNTRLRRGAKANHLAYLGDGDIGEDANVGAGTIFCNYDGFQKHRTVICQGAFIGSDAQIVAPVTIGEGAYVATGTTVTRDVPAQALAIARVAQIDKEGYAPRLRARLRAAAEEAKR